MLSGALGGAEMTVEAMRGKLVFVSLDCHGLKIFGFEDLLAVKAFHVIYPVAAGDHNCVFVFAGGLHGQKLGIQIILTIQKAVSRARFGNLERPAFENYNPLAGALER
ncbi:MAG TPA: hypothetical protein VG273_22440 [Bryobacteraceae bacterium]|jgi:hypothetical protein|nr:hypothetical protein [Bryobacteraceae bacterium]